MPRGAYTPVGNRAEGGCRPGAQALFDYILSTWEGLGSFGCYNPNSRAGSGWSLHREGRAIDIAVPPHLKHLGDEVFHWAIDNADHLGLQEIQWYGQIWTSRRHPEGIRKDFSSAAGLHYDHVHLGVADGRTFTIPSGSPAAGTPPNIDWGALWPALEAMELNGDQARKLDEIHAALYDGSKKSFLRDISVRVEDIRSLLLDLSKKGSLNTIWNKVKGL
jgi:hypothetical protein